MKWCRAELALYLIIAVLGIGNMITACGQKGALYIPADKNTLQQNQ